MTIQTIESRQKLMTIQSIESREGRMTIKPIELGQRKKLVNFFLRFYQLVFAFFAIYITVTFETHIDLSLDCSDEPEIIRYPIKYPFNLEKTELPVRRSCEEYTKIVYRFPINFSSSPRFFCATGLLSILYSTGSLIKYLLE